MGLIHIYCGDGKGKTTSAVGLAIRAAGSGKKVVFVQFLKDGTSSEISILNSIENITVIAGKVCDKFAWNMNDAEKEATKNLHTENLKKAIALNADLLILDEVCGACKNMLIDEYILKNLIIKLPPETELVLTGREPLDYMIENADYISEIKKIRHPFDKGISARKGIEY